MTYKASVDLITDRVASRQDVVLAAAITAVAAGSVAIYIGGSVAMHRQVEIINAIKQIMTKIRDDNLLDGSDALYAGMDIDYIGDSGFSSAYGDANIATVITATSVGIGISDTAQDVAGACVPVESAIGLLLDGARESNFATS